MIRTLSKGTIVAFLFAGLYYLLRGLKISRKGSAVDRDCQFTRAHLFLAGLMEGLS